MYAFVAKYNRWMPLRATPEYKQKKRILRNAWIGGGIVMCGLPLHGVLVLAILATFLSLMFLDESSYSYPIK